jgi:pyruvate formate lyase activating enzyme
MVIEQAQTSVTSAVHHYNSADRGLILHTQRLSTEDGPGIRTTVFFKGCPLSCEWCHNPESISTSRQVHWLETRCIGCLICVKTCPDKILRKEKDGIRRDLTLCKACGRCADECPSRAMEMLGKEITLEELVTELLKDKVYYDNSGGGITLSGGEPLMQPDFAAGVLRRMKGNGVHTAVDTCGLCSRATLDKVLPLTDMILFDLKEIDPQRHRQFAGQDNRIILDNLLFIRDYLSAHPGRQLWIRTPLIPGATATADTVRRIGQFIHANIEDAMQRWELCSFNNLCRDKYRRLGLEWKYRDVLLLSKAELTELEQAGKNSGVNPEIVFATGATRVES